MKAWTISQVARVSGRSISHTAQLARSGLVPGYTAARDIGRATGRTGAQIPAELAEAFAVVLRAGAHSPRLVELMRTSPAEVAAAGEALVALAQAAMDNPAADDGRAA